MRHSIHIGPTYVKAEMAERRTPEETRQFAEAQLAALRQSGLRRLLISVSASRPVFKVQDWDLEAVLEEMAGMEGLKVALIADTAELAMSHQYVELLARQRKLAFRSFREEWPAVNWLLSQET
jgi:hypothetical protein